MFFASWFITGYWWSSLLWSRTCLSDSGRLCPAWRRCRLGPPGLQGADWQLSPPSAGLALWRRPAGRCFLLTVGMAGMMLPGGDKSLGPGGHPQTSSPGLCPQDPPDAVGLCRAVQGEGLKSAAGQGGVGRLGLPAGLKPCPEPLKGAGAQCRPQAGRHLSPAGGSGRGEEGFPWVLCPHGSLLPPQELGRCLSWGRRCPGLDAQLPQMHGAGLCYFLSGEAALLGLVGLGCDELPAAGAFLLPAWAGHPASAVLVAGNACIQELILPPSGHCRPGMVQVGTRGEGRSTCSALALAAVTASVARPPHSSKPCLESSLSVLTDRAQRDAPRHTDAACR
ncbi:protein tyrosine phosphatase type IVA 3 isoform X2 [Cervus canadensis]|uniref:protein tyrosine phosphatase type IVA 3 isoform X2 n=1 Tax=Cervus canadensis TaxID=1574408 RepID=UPI001C9E6A2B|nr:protein tyrosine phosphatase type IVA 3 isoform X2 [Cervus canadensis]